MRAQKFWLSSMLTPVHWNVGVASCSMRLVPNYRIIFGRNLRGWTGAVLSRLKGYGAARWVLRELVEAAVMALSGMLGCGCVRSRRGELWRIVNAVRAHSRA